jgi:parallel beta-helix repeat protein
LRKAIIDANSTAGPDLIDFNIPGSGVHIFSLITALPTITDPVTIDGYTQPGSVKNNLASNDNAILTIEITGTNIFNLSADNGLVISAGSTTVTGLIINGFKGVSGGVGSGIILMNKGQDVIAGNFIGVDPNGTNQIPNGNGILIMGCDNNVIGGAQTFSRNLISGNGVGVYVQQSGAYGNLIEGNFIGVNRSATGALGNTGAGIAFGNVGAASFAGSVGGTVPGAGNVISGNTGSGIDVSGPISSLKIQGNLIGTDITGTKPLGNLNGIYVDTKSATPLIIGFFGNTGSGNTVAFNTGAGIWIAKGTGNLLSANSFFGNKQLGIDLAKSGNEFGVEQNDSGDGDTGANNLQNYPVLTRASLLTNGLTFVSGSLNSAANTKFRIELFANAAADPSGFGQGQTFMGGFDVTTDANGDAGFNNGGFLNIGLGQYISATATDPNGNTSEFARSIIVKADGPGSLQFNAAAFSIKENQGQVTINVTRTGGSFGTDTVQYATVAGGTAAAGTDYTSVTGTITWGDGELSTKSFTIPIKDNALTGPNKTVNLALSNPTNGATLGAPSTAVLTIVDDESAPSGTLAFTTSAYSVNESGGQATITVSRTGGSNGAISVAYSTLDGSATSSDYTESLGTLNWADGDTASKTFKVSITNDSLDEADETVNLSLSNPTGGATLGNPSSAVLTILDDDPPPKVSIDDFSVAEGNSGIADFTFTVSLAAASGQTVSVNYTTTDVTAQAGSDYQAANAMVTFGPGETSKKIIISVNGDTQAEPNETFAVNLYNLINASVGKVTGIGTIMDDDSNSSAPTIQFDQSSYSVQEDLGAFTITVTRTGDTSAPASVDYKTVDGSASQKADFEYAAGTLTFAANESSKTIQLLLNEDMYVEGNEDFSVVLTNPSGASLDQQSIASVTIIDDLPEAATNPVDDAQSFVYLHYHDFLNREPDATGLAFWTNQITACNGDAKCIDAARANVSAAFYLSIEFQQTGYLLYLMQKESYATLPKYATFMRDLQEISRGVVVNAPGWQQKLSDSQQQFATAWASRAEFKAAYDAMSNSAFVDTLYANAGVNAPQSDKDALTARLDSAGETRAAALLEVASNATFRQKEMNAGFVLMEYYGYLRRDPDANPDSDMSGYNFWLDKLNKFGDYQSAEMVRAFVISAEYRQRFGQ